MAERDSKGCSRNPGQLNEKTIGGKDFPPRPLSTTVEWTCATRSAPVPWRAQLAHKIHLWSAAVGGIQTAHLRNGTCNQCTTTFPRIYPQWEREWDGASGGIRAEARRPHEANVSAVRTGRAAASIYGIAWKIPHAYSAMFRSSFFYNGPCYRRSAVSKPIAHSIVRTPPPLCARSTVRGRKPSQCLNFPSIFRAGDITRTIPLEMI